MAFVLFQTRDVARHGLTDSGLKALHKVMPGTEQLRRGLGSTAQGLANIFARPWMQVIEIVVEFGIERRHIRKSLWRLEIEHLEVFDAADRFWDRYRIDSDATAFGARWAGFARASVFPTLSTALAGGAADPRATELCDRLEAGIAERLRAAPEQMQIPLAHVVLMKRPTT